ncbi:MAG: FtsW/RodA/SpoVE family cell cycle protein [Clostridia bacterium]|nr:FtsW/RodA/SpoVE family cell cycle protein [Clostridia bacterium]
MILERRGAGALLTFTVLFTLSACGLLAFSGGAFDIGVAAYGLGAALLLILTYGIFSVVFRHIDRLTLVLCFFLVSIGLVLLVRLDMEVALKQLIMLAIGIGLMFATIAVIKAVKDFGKLNYVFMIASFGLLAFAYLFGDAVGGARNWVSIGGVSFQPSEISKVLFVVISAYFFAKKRHKFASVMYALYVGACVILLVLSNDLGAVLLYAATFLIVFFAGTGRTGLTLLGVGVAGAGAVASYYIVPHVKTRVMIWRDPWIYYHNQGYQIVQGLMAIAAGGAFGAGLGLGYPEAIPVNTSDYIYAVICEEFGIIFGIIVILLYLVFIVRGMIIARNATSRFDALLVFGATCMLSLQSFIIIAGVIKLIPLTGITLPFISAGGSSLIACLVLVGIIEGVAVKNGKRDEKDVVDAGGEVI